jgi:ABC-type Fe3+/spermidine/putrescine transport system ATPase subunit
MVTHDQEEALFLADRVLVLEAGAVRQQGAPADIYRNPVDEFVAGFLGAINLLAVTIEGSCLRIGAQRFAPPAEVAAAIQATERAGRLHLAVRPEQLTVAPGYGEKPPEAIVGALVATEFGGAVVTLRLDVEGQSVAVLALSPDVLAAGPWTPGMPVWVRIRQAQLLPAGEAAR